jgi:Protein of unknown function (DUF3147)
MDRQMDPDNERICIDIAGIRGIGTRQALIRFSAGAGASAVAALVSQFAGSAVAGPLLALPAILIASLTLIADDDGTSVAVDDARGAVLGGIGLVAFAVVAFLSLGKMPTWLALLAATATWAAVSLALYTTQRALQRHHVASASTPSRSDQHRRT